MHEQDRPDSPAQPVETRRLARDPHDRPRYGRPPGSFGSHGGWRVPSDVALRSPQDTRNLDDVRVHERMTRGVAHVDPTTPVERAAQRMAERDCGALPVLGQNGVLVGMITDRDIAMRVVARGMDARIATVADCMTDRVFSCFANESVAELMRQMARHQVRRMPIVDERGRLVGIVAQSDLARHAGTDPLPEERRFFTQTMSELSKAPPA